MCHSDDNDDAAILLGSCPTTSVENLIAVRGAGANPRRREVLIQICRSLAPPQNGQWEVGSGRQLLTARLPKVHGVEAGEAAVDGVEPKER